MLTIMLLIRSSDRQLDHEQKACIKLGRELTTCLYTGATTSNQRSSCGCYRSDDGQQLLDPGTNVKYQALPSRQPKPSMR